MNGLTLLIGMLAIGGTAVAAYWWEHVEARRLAEAAEFRRRLATIPDLDDPGAETGAAPPSRPGGCAGLGVRAIRPRTVAGPVRVDCPI